MFTRAARLASKWRRWTRERLTARPSQVEQLLPGANGVLSELAQERLDLACEVKALVCGDDVVGAALEVVVESASQLGQDRLELGNQFCATALRESFAHVSSESRTGSSSLTDRTEKGPGDAGPFLFPERSD
jgi:hypothetical protein